MEKDIPHILGTLSLLAYGISSLLFPHRIARLIAQELNSPRGTAEFRIVNGGYFIGLSSFALVINHPLVFMVLGIGWLGAASARVLAILLDRPKFESIYLGLLVFEMLMGLLLIV